MQLTISVIIQHEMKIAQPVKIAVVMNNVLVIIIFYILYLGIVMFNDSIINNNY